ncbi:MAG TPA: hypothetical protein VH079_05800 [Terriglobales bacterium]|nr:hypothetical protein [Terriglobales bacterium]
MPIRVSADARYRLMGLNGMPEGDALIRIGMCVYRGGEGIFDLAGAGHDYCLAGFVFRLGLSRFVSGYQRMGGL